MMRAAAPQRFTCTPDAMPPELHQTIAHWLLHISHAGGERDARTREAVKAIQEITDWTDRDVRLAMTLVADRLSPSVEKPK